MQPPGSSLPLPGILIVDDEPVLRELLRVLCAGRGFAVHVASSGLDAVDLYRRHQDAVALVLLDVCMPGMDGPQTLAELRLINPAVRACFMSGFAGDYSPEDLRSRGALRLFDKPFQVTTLADELWQLAVAGTRKSA
jgi:CheY-like chemotaxis protein